MDGDKRSCPCRERPSWGFVQLSDTNTAICLIGIIGRSKLINPDGHAMILYSNEVLKHKRQILVLSLLLSLCIMSEQEVCGENKDKHHLSFSRNMDFAEVSGMTQH